MLNNQGTKLLPVTQCLKLLVLSLELANRSHTYMKFQKQRYQIIKTIGGKLALGSSQFMKLAFMNNRELAIHEHL